MKPQKISAPNNEKAIEKPMLTVEKAEMKPRMSPQKMRMSVLAKRKGPRKPKSTLLKKVKMVSVMKMKHVRSADMMICRPARGPRQRRSLHGDAAGAAGAAGRRRLRHLGRRGARRTVAIRVV